MNKNKIFLLIFLIWVLIIVSFVGFKQYTLESGKSVILKTVPVDPRDLFRGDYVILNYEISSIKTDQIFQEGQQVFVSLDPKNDYFQASEISFNKPSDGLFIKGNVKRISSGQVDLTYGIESYFVPEGQGKKIERYQGDFLFVEVMVDNFGNSVIKRLLIDGEEVSFE
jgi:uncharacterized membrane-anchored protein